MTAPLPPSDAQDGFAPRPMLASPGTSAVPALPPRAGGLPAVFLAGGLVLFLELALIRWLPAHVLYLTFFTNVVLLASFLGASAGCLAAESRRDWLAWTPAWLALTLAAGHAVEALRPRLEPVLAVGRPADQQHVFFGTETAIADAARHIVPIEVLAGLFFCLACLSMIGPGQAMGRTLRRAAGQDPLKAYAANLAGSIAGVLLFAAASWLELAPAWWFAAAAAGLAVLFAAERLASTRSASEPLASEPPASDPSTSGRSEDNASRPLAPDRFGAKALRPDVLAAWAACMAACVWLASLTSGSYSESRLAEDGPGEVNIVGQRLWSPYYRIDYLGPPARELSVNLLGHQKLTSRDRRDAAYSLPHLLRRDSGALPAKHILLLGAGSGNDASRALQWAPERVDAVEIDPAILRLGQREHPDRPYSDPRVRTRVADGRAFMKRATSSYDMIVYSLVDSLVLHSSYSNIRLESYLFTREAFEDARKRLKPGGWLVVYNYFRRGWIAARIAGMLAEVFGEEPLVLPMPYADRIGEDSSGGLTLIIAGATAGLRRSFQASPEYWHSKRLPPDPAAPDGFKQRPPKAEQNRWFRFGLAKVDPVPGLAPAKDDWPFLYLRRPMLPAHTLRGIALMAALSLVFLWLVPGVPGRPSSMPPGAQCASGAAAGENGFPADPLEPSGGASSVPRQPASIQSPSTLSRLRAAWSLGAGRMFFLGAGFMLIETKAVVQLAVLSGSTWTVNTAVFLAALAAALASALLVRRLKPKALWPSYAGIFASLALQAAVPTSALLGLGETLGWTAAAGLAMLPLVFAGVVFSAAFGNSRQPHVDFGSNIAGAVLGGLAENASMLVGFRGLALIAAGFYALSALASGPDPGPRAASRSPSPGPAPSPAAPSGQVPTPPTTSSLPEPFSAISDSPPEAA